MRRNTERGETRREESFLRSEGFMSLGSTLTLSSASFVIRSEDVGTRFGGVALVEFFNEFVSMCEIGSGSPLEFFVGAFVTDPLYIVE